MKLHSNFVLFLVWAALGFMGISTLHPEAANAVLSDVARIKKSGVLRVACVTEDTPPFIFTDPATGTRKGIDVDLAEAMAAKLNVKVQWVNGRDSSFTSLFELLEKKQVDLALSALFPALDRTDQAYFTRAYLEVKQILLVQRMSASRLKLGNKYDSIIARDGLSFGYYENSGNLDSVLKQIIHAKWIPYARKNVSDPPIRGKMIADFVRGDLTAVWIDELELAKWRKAKPDIDLYGFPVDVPEGNIPVVVAMPREELELKDWVNLFITQARRGNGLNLIYQHYLKSPAKVPKPL